MLYISTALFNEAKPFIGMYRLKKVSAPGSLQLFEGDRCRLSVSGAGQVCAVSAVVYMLTRYAADYYDTFANIGNVVGANIKGGEIVLCHKIINGVTGKTLYPEMLYEHPFYEGILGTAGEDAPESVYDLHDLEGAFAYEAAQMFLPSSQIHCIKAVSSNFRSGLPLETAGVIRSWLDGISGRDKPSEILSEEENRMIGLVTERLRMTFAMAQNLRQACITAKIRGLDITKILSEYTESKAVGKNESKAVFTQIINHLYEWVR